MRTAIIGSREGFEKKFVWDKLDELFKPGIRIDIISGGARGIDTLAKEWAMFHQAYTVEIIKPINPSNKLDYLFRNIEIITKSDRIIAFWDGKSKGTKFVIDYAKARNKEILIIKNENRSN